MGYLPSCLDPTISNHIVIFLLSLLYMGVEEMGLQGSRELCFDYQRSSPSFGLGGLQSL